MLWAIGVSLTGLSSCVIIEFVCSPFLQIKLCVELQKRVTQTCALYERKS